MGEAMPSDAATAIAYVGAFVGLVGGGVALFNSRMAVAWKRAELANSYLKDLNTSPELTFACRSLDWNGGKLVAPESLRPFLPDGEKTIQHDKLTFAHALRPDLQIGELDDDPRVQIYRTSMDSFLSWLSLVASGLNRNLFAVADIEEVGYWVAKLQSERITHNFICAYGYQENINKLVVLFRRKKSPYQYWMFATPRTSDLVDDLIMPVKIKLPSPKATNETSGKKK
jgi:hypothetical protein